LGPRAGGGLNGAGTICSALKELGARTVFGLPGTQNAGLYDALRRAGLRSVVASDEGAAAFMASGYARAAGTVGLLTTIPGPGFVYALAGVMEARHDSVPLLWLTQRAVDDGQAYPLQRIDQPAMAREAVKASRLVERAEDLADTLYAAWDEALGGEPGPVLVEIAAPLLLQDAVPQRQRRAGVAPRPDVRALHARLSAARRPLIFAGQGAQASSQQVRALARRWRAPVLFTSSGRGVLADADPLALVRDFSFGLGEALPALLAQADLVLVLGCKFTHNGSAGGRLQLPAERLVRVDSSAAVLAANYPASLALHARVEDVLEALDAEPPLGRSHWSDEELAAWKSRFAAESAGPIEHEPLLAECDGAPVQALFEALQSAYGEDVIYTADAGLHQALTRRYARVTQPRGLLCPSDFQSMGFGLSGAIGAALARPEAAVIACVGDGALTLSLGELLTAVRERIDLSVVVFNDASFGLIRRQQLLNYGQSAGTDLLNPDYAALAQAVGCSYFRVGANLAEDMSTAAGVRGVRLIEVRLGQTASLARATVARQLRDGVRGAVPDSLWQLLKRAAGL
jgi:acetolactate synthase-1/2/3 large subunit